jgi:hypothetical protein
MRHFASHLFRSVAFIAVILGVSLTSASSATPSASPSAPPTAESTDDFLFVQSAKSMTYDRSTNTLTLEDVSPTTLFFSDRPARIVGSMETRAFVPFWTKGRNSFLEDPPNADLSIIEGGALHEAVVILENPRLQGNRLTYTVKVIKGSVPEKAINVSVFID